MSIDATDLSDIRTTRAWVLERLLTSNDTFGGRDLRLVADLMVDYIYSGLPPNLEAKKKECNVG